MKFIWQARLLRFRVRIWPPDCSVSMVQWWKFLPQARQLKSDTINYEEKEQQLVSDCVKELRECIHTHTVKHTRLGEEVERAFRSTRYRPPQESPTARWCRCRTSCRRRTRSCCGTRRKSPSCSPRSSSCSTGSKRLGDCTFSQLLPLPPSVREGKCHVETLGVPYSWPWRRKS